MRNSPGNSRVAAIAVALAVLASAAANAHRRDEYLQAARVAIDPDRVEIELDLTPGIAVASLVLSDIDLDGNGAIDTAESHAYAQRVLSEITLEMDGMPLALAVIDSRFPALDAMRLGDSAIRLAMAAPMSDLGAGSHRLHYRNTHRSAIGAYLANALVPTSERVTFARQHRDQDQRDLVIEWSLGPATRPQPWLVGSAACVLAGLGVLWWRRSHGARSA